MLLHLQNSRHNTMPLLNSPPQEWAMDSQHWLPHHAGSTEEPRQARQSGRQQTPPSTSTRKGQGVQHDSNVYNSLMKCIVSDKMQPIFRDHLLIQTTYGTTALSQFKYLNVNCLTSLCKAHKIKPLKRSRCVVSIRCHCTSITLASHPPTNLLLRKLQSWVGGQLIANGGVEGSAQVLAARRARTMRREDLGRGWVGCEHICI